MNVCKSGLSAMSRWNSGEPIPSVRLAARTIVPPSLTIGSAPVRPLIAWYHVVSSGWPAALVIVKDGGTIVLAASLTEGIGSPEFQRLIADNPDLQTFMHRILGKEYFVMDQWQLEELAKVVRRCKVKVVSHGLSAEILRKCHVEPAASVESAVAESLAEYGPQAQVAVIPKG